MRIFILICFLGFFSGCGGSSTTDKDTDNTTPDTTAPVITLVGNASMTLSLGQTFVEPGYSATDAHDGNVNVSVKGTVDINTEGTYTLEYIATDTAGNSSTKIRTITVSHTIINRNTYFPAGSFFYQDVSALPKSTDSDKIISALNDAGGWGHSNRFQIDFSIDVLNATSATLKQAFITSNDHYSPDCDTSLIPIPSDGNIEGENGYACTGNGDCHLIVHAPFESRLYEMWRADINSNGTFNGGCLAKWDTSRVYPETGRGEQCTSADAAGLPIAPLLFTADEVAAGEINHAIRFILPNNRIRAQRYVRPATHGTNTTGSENAPQYGVHFRLRADFPLNTLPNEGARVVARALQRFGMYHADGGNIALTAQSDRHTSAKWDGLLAPQDLKSINVSDFEVIHHSDDIELTYDCTRTPLSD